MLKRTLLVIAVASIIICLFSFRPALADSISLENRENFYIDYSTYDDGSLPVSNNGYNLTSGDVLSVDWNAGNGSAPNPPCVYLLNDYQFHGWDYVRKYAFLDPASRGYLRKENAWAMNMSCTVTSTDTYHVIIDNTNWNFAIQWPKILMISYQAVQNYPNSYYLAVKTDTAGAASISGEGWYLRGYNKILTAPSTVTVNSSFQYRFNYWDVDGASYGLDASQIAVVMNANHTATAHYTPHKLLEHMGGFLITESTYDDGLLNGSITGYTLDAGNQLHVSWDGDEPAVYLLNDYQFHGWNYARKWSFQDPASRSYIQKIISDTGTIDYNVTSSGTYYIIIDNILWTPLGLIPPMTHMNYYDAFLDLPTSYYLSVKTNPNGVASISGEGWYTGGSAAVLTAPTPIPISSSTQYAFDYWDVDSIAYGSGVNPITVGMAANHTATAHYILQYQVFFVQSGLDSSASGTILTVNNAPKTFSILPYTFWESNGSVLVYSYNATVPSSTPTKQFVLKNVLGPTSPIIITGSTTVTGNYGAQYQVNFSQTGVGNDFSGTIATIDSVKYNFTTLPASFWWDGGSSHAFAFESPLIIAPNSKQNLWTNTNGLSTLQNDSLTVSSSGNVTGNYKTQYYLTVKTNPVGIAAISGEGWYDQASSVTLTAPTVTNYAFLYWDVDGTSQGNGTMAITVIMGAPHIATANYQTSPSPHPSTVGGYSVSLVKEPPASYYSVYMALIAASVLILTFRKRKKR